MLTVSVFRFADLKEATIGSVYVDGRFECFSLEDQWQPNKVAAETRIPTGTYKLKLRTVGRLHEKYRERFVEHRGMIELENVPGFTDVLIHIGNTDRDSAGCLLVGDGAVSAGELTNSTQAYRRLYGQISQAILAGEGAELEIEEIA